MYKKGHILRIKVGLNLLFGKGDKTHVIQIHVNFGALIVLSLFLFIQWKNEMLL